MILLTPTFENVSGIFCVFWPKDPFFRKPRGVPGTLLWGDVTFTCLRFPLAPKSPWITVEFGNFLLKFPRVTFVIPITQPRMRCAQLGVSTATDVVDWFNKSYFTYTCARLRGFFQIEHGFFYFSWNQLIKISKKKFVKLTLIFDDANNLTKKYTWHSVCEMKNSISPKIFRQINSFVISLVKTLVSRNFCRKSV